MTKIIIPCSYCDKELVFTMPKTIECYKVFEQTKKCCTCNRYTKLTFSSVSWREK